MIQEEPGLLTGTIPHVGSVEIHARPVCLEKLLDGLTLLVDAVYLMTVQVGPVGSNRDGSHLGNCYEKFLQVLGLEFVHLLVRKPADTLLSARQFELRLSVFLCIYAFRPLGGISELVGVELGVVIHENVEAVLFYFEGLDCPSVVEEKVGIALRRQRQMRLHEAASALDRDDIEEVLLRERFELLLRCEAFVGNHRVLVARDAALGEHVGERADVGCASEELLVVHGITAVIAEAVDVKQVYLWLEAALRVVAELGELHRLRGSDQAVAVEEDEDVALVDVFLHEAGDVGATPSERLQKRGVTRRFERKAGHQVGNETRLVVRLQAAESRLFDGPQDGGGVDRFPEIRKDKLEPLAQRGGAVPEEHDGARLNDIGHLGGRFFRPDFAHEATLRRDKSVGRDLAETFTGNFAAALNDRIVFAEAFVDVPVVSDLLDLRVFLPRKVQNVVRFLRHFHPFFNQPIRFAIIKENGVDFNPVFPEKPNNCERFYYPYFVDLVTIKKIF